MQNLRPCRHWPAAGVALILLPLSGALSQGRPEQSSAVEIGVDSITVRDIRAHLRFLAGDELQGRGTGHAGNQVAAIYLEAVLDRLGLAPADPAPRSGFFQQIEMYTPALGPGSSLLVIDATSGGERKTRLGPGDDFYPSDLSASTEVSGELVFAGYGITAPEYQYDDYDGLDASGKIVLLLEHEPQELDSRSRFAGLEPIAGSFPAPKIENARRHGAAGVLFVPDAANHPGPENGRLQFRRAWPERLSVQNTRFQIAEIIDSMTLPAGNVSAAAADRLLMQGAGPAASIRAAQRAIDGGGRPASFPLSGRKATLAVDLARKRVLIPNVIGYMAGSDPAKRNELVVVSGHFDHVGIDLDGQIYNGADDDASGTTGTLEIAEAFVRAADHGQRPKRTVVFALWNAEEKGLLGSNYYVRHPLPSFGRPVGQVQMDHIGRNEEVLDPTDPRFRGLKATAASDNVNAMHLLGYSYSPDLAAIVAEENRSVGLKIKQELDTGEHNIIRRSDHWPFLEAGVPSVLLHTGLHPDYHRPTDDYDKINYEKMQKIVRLGFRIAWRLANDERMPRYQKPDLTGSAR